MKTRVAILYGGRSGEHEISVRSADAVMKAIDPATYDVIPYLISPEGKWNPAPIQPEPGANPGIDVAFPLVHGTFGEDGTLQGLLEMAALPYVGPGVMASALSMDKEMVKRLWQQRGLPVAEFLVTTDPAAVEAALPYPVFVKPANLGSSVGISKAKDRAGIEAALGLASQFDSKVIVERSIEGREFECAVLGNEDPYASTPCEVLPSREFYDYEDKYLLDNARIELPAKLDAPATAELRRIAREAYLACGCEGMSRVDFLYENATQRLYLNEINTIPGFTSISMFPKMLAHDGIGFTELIHRLIQLALRRHAVRNSKRYAR